ncbi:MAG TPA: GGDEF domain-containing protein [Lacipirellulaceae bacterium]
MITDWHNFFLVAVVEGKFAPADYIFINGANLALIGLPVTVALGSVALIGYMFGQRTRTKMMAALDERRQQELDRAARIAWQLEHIATNLRKDLASHHAQVAKFKRCLRRTRDCATDAAWEQLCADAEAILGPTMQLAHQLRYAYDQIRQQSEALETFTQGRTDPLTGVGNGRALEQQLRVLLATAARGGSQFCIALVSLDRTSADAAGRSLGPILPMLPKLAAAIRACMRGPDFVARYGDEEFVVVMPSTTSAGATVFGDRFRKRILQDLGTSVCCGIAQVQNGDDSRSLFARADSALYSAKAAGSNRLFVHTGTHIREHNAPAAVSDPAANSHPANSNSDGAAAKSPGSDAGRSADAGNADKPASAPTTA